MINISWVLTFLLLAFIGNIFLRKFLKKIEGPDPLTCEGLDSVRRRKVSYNEYDVKEVLKNWGKEDKSYSIPDAYLPLHGSFLELLANYREIAFDPTTKVFDRSLTATPFHENNNFLQIGNWGDGSEVLIRLHSRDPKVYMAEIEDGNTEQPAELAETIGEYLILARDAEETSNQILIKKGYIKRDGKWIKKKIK